MGGRILAAVASGAAGLAVWAAPASAGGYYGYDAGYGDGPPPVVERRVVVERPVYVRPRPVVREVIVERPVYLRPRPVVREVIVERPVVVRPRPVVHEVVVERERFAAPAYGPRPVGYRYGYGPGYGPGYNPYE